MLQLASLTFAAQSRLASEEAFPPSWSDMAELEQVTDRWLRQVLEVRTELARDAGEPFQLLERIDRALRTQEKEHLDDPAFPAATKWKMVRALHRMNQAFLSYHRFYWLLKPVIEEIANHEGRPARVLELASGSGELTLELARLSKRNRLPAELWGSDYIPEYVQAANSAARRRGSSARFLEVNAFDMNSFPPGQFDVMFISQSMHHFTPGQLAMMIAQAGQTGVKAFVGIDGQRSLFLLGLLPVVTLPWLSRPYIHDAWITARTLYTELELELVAAIAAPTAVRMVRGSTPAMSVLTLRFVGVTACGEEGSGLVGNDQVKPALMKQEENGKPAHV